MRVSPKISDVVLATFVVAIAALLLIPLPTWLLDLLIVTNLGVGFILLLLALYVPSALSLLSFPTILLLTTLFRLGLDVASTRLILTQGDAGTVIYAFGNFLVQGDILVGIVLFLVITVVQYLVVAKGAHRVSEVAARFALDALPGKQMAIDADLRAGLITAVVAQQKREELQKESQLYGAMDGAMKFVQGDAIAGIVIIVVNICGGVAKGFIGGLSFEEALQTYTILTIGDGLVHQVPAILTSICAGLVVTRISTSERSTLGADVGMQLGSRPGVLQFCGALLMLLGLATPLPALPFLVVGLFLAGIGVRRQRQLHRIAQLDSQVRQSKSSEESIDVHAEEVLRCDRTIEIAFATGKLRELESSWSGYRDAIAQFRREFRSLVGVDLAQVKVVERSSVRGSTIEVSMQGRPIARTAVPSAGSLPTVWVACARPIASAIEVDVVAEHTHPISGASYLEIKDSPATKALLAAMPEVKVYPLEQVLMDLAAWLVENPEEIIDAAAVHEVFRDLEKKFPGFISESIGGRTLGIAPFTQLLQELVKARASVADIRVIIELVSRYCASHGITPTETGEVVIADIVGFIMTTRPRLWLAWSQEAAISRAIVIQPATAQSLITDPRKRAELRDLWRSVSPRGQGVVGAYVPDEYIDSLRGLLALPCIEQLSRKKRDAVTVAVL